MSEKAFRLVLITVVGMWIVFVLVPAAVDFAPRAWSTLQYFLPGDRPEVQIIVKDTGGGAVAEARVTILTDHSAEVAFTDKAGQVMFHAVPVDRGYQIKAQKLDYDVAILANVILPRRQRARFVLTLYYDPYRRLYIGHETASQAGGQATIGVSLLDQASRLPLTPPGSSDQWENIPAVAMQAQRDTQRLYVLTPDRVIVFNLFNGTIIHQVSLNPPEAEAMAISPQGDSLYIYNLGRDGISHWLTVIDTRTWVTRYTAQVLSNAHKAILVPSRDGQRIYVTGVNDRTITVLDARQARRITGYRTNGNIKDMTIARDGRMLYVLLDQEPFLLALDLANNGTLSPVLSASPGDLLGGATELVYAEYQMSKWLCLLKPEADQVVLVDLNAETTHAVSVGNNPVALAAISGDDQVYVANKDDNSLSIISLTNHRLIDTVEVRSKPVMLAVP